MNETQIKLIEAAEVEFADHGFEGASIRKITARAGANVAAINYHFGSKETLFIEMVRYRLEPINSLRVRMLKQAMADANGAALPISQIVDITVRPLITSFVESGEDQLHFMRAMGRGFSEESRFTETLYKDILAELIALVSQALRQSLPDLPPHEVSVCQHFLGCSLSGAMMQYQRFSHLLGSAGSANAMEAMTDRLIAFITGGIGSVARLSRESLPEADLPPPPSSAHS